MEKIAKYNIHVTIARNIINFSLTAAELLSLHSTKAYLKTAKEISSLFVCVVTVAEILTPDFWNSAKTSVSKQGNRVCKLIYSGLDTFLLIPNKWNLIDLAKWCAPAGVVLCKDLFVIGSAGFGIWHASEEIAHAQRIIEKNTDRLKSGFPPPSGKHLPQLNKEIADLRQGLHIDIHHLDPHQICQATELMEKKKIELERKEGKRWRILHPHSLQSADYQIKTACLKIDAYRRQAAKAQLIRAFEIAKIAIVALQILLTASLSIATLAAFSAEIGAGIFAAGLAIGTISLALTVYDIFFWKNPKQIVYPTTSLSLA